MQSDFLKSAEMNNQVNDAGTLPTHQKTTKQPQKKLNEAKLTASLSSMPAPRDDLPNKTSASDIEALRLTSSFGKQITVNKVLVNIPVTRPSKDKFVRVRDGEKWEFPTFILEVKELNETYLLSESIAEIVHESARAVKILLAVDRRGNIMLVPVPLPREDGRRNQWHESLVLAMERGKHKWVRIVANMSAGAYDLLEAQCNLTEPVWPDKTMAELIRIAFAGKIITDESHPVIEELLGRA